MTCTAKPKLYASLRSPFARRVRLRLEELNLEYDCEMINVFEPPVNFAEINPLGRVPVLVLADTQILIDSHQIDEYLRARYGSQKLYLNDAISEARARSWSALAMGASEAVVTAFLETLRPQPKRSLELEVEVQENLARVLRSLEGEIVGPFFAGDDLKWWDLDLGAFLSYCDLRRGRQVIDAYPRLRGYLSRLDQRASFVKTAPPPA